jgi:protein gp37
MDHEWARDLRDRCGAAGVAFYFKQSASWTTEMGRTLDGRTHEEYPLPHPASGLARELGVWVDG